jgi:hypothetical protein
MSINLESSVYVSINPNSLGFSLCMCCVSYEEEDTCLNHMRRRIHV